MMSMNENGPEQPEQVPTEDAGASPGREDVSPEGGAPMSLGRRIRQLILRAAAVVCAFLVLIAMLTAAAGWYTSRPEFCRSCHIMEPYYTSWQHSSHKDVSCIKCHFAPGVGEKVRGKLLGLVQLAKYVTRSEGPRPAAEIPDASCLRSGCHETRTMAGRVEFYGVPFDHQPHLEKLRRGKKLRCTSCHSQIVQGSHMTVTTSTCFLCHFKGEFFNEGLGACTRCHQIPEEEFDLGGGVTFHHDLAYERGVDCANCHGDLIRGDGAVPPERCGVCHNREDDLKRRDDHEFIHQKHVTEHKVDCLDCHLEITHSMDRDKIAHAAADCASCHPDHHREQVALLQGTVGKTISAHASSMAAARIACPACHRVKEVSSTGTVLWKASIAVCGECHDAATTARIQTHHQEVQEALVSLRSELQRVRKALEPSKLAADRRDKVRAQLDQWENDVGFLCAANSIHNIHYATTLMRAVAEQLTALCKELKIDEPKIAIPEMTEKKE